MRPAQGEVAGPKVVRPLRPETDPRSVIHPEPALPGSSGGHLPRRRQGNAPPGPFLTLLIPAAISWGTLHVHGPACVPKKSRDPVVAVLPILGRERDNVRAQRVFVAAAPRHFPLCRAMLPKYATGDTVRNAELLLDMSDARPHKSRASTCPNRSTSREPVRASTPGEPVGTSGSSRLANELSADDVPCSISRSKARSATIVFGWPFSSFSALNQHISSGSRSRYRFFQLT